MGNVKFLFLGARLKDCFTYLHYVEKALDVPYRYDQAFSGTVIDEEGKRSEQTWQIHTACKGVKKQGARECGRFEEYLAERGYLRRARLGNSFAACISEEDAYREIRQAIEREPAYFLAAPYRLEELRHEYTHDAAAGRITHC